MKTKMKVAMIMEFKNKKIILITIIVLLVIFLPLTVWGFVLNQNKDDNANPNHDLMKDGYLWFYDSNNNLLNKYQCQNEGCDLAEFSIDDDNYNIDYYKDGTKNKMEYKGSTHTLIKDGDIINLYSVKDNQVLTSFKSVKTYNTTLENNLYIVQNKDNDLWGIIKINENGINDLTIPMATEYQFIGLKNAMNENNQLKTDKFVVKKDDKWFITNLAKENLSEPSEDEIVDYNDKFIISKNENYLVYNYNNERLLSTYNITKYFLLDNNIGIVSNNNLYVLDGEKLLGRYALTNEDSDIEFSTDINVLIVKIDGTDAGTIALS